MDPRQNQSEEEKLDKDLKKTEIGNFYLKNKVSIFVLVFIVIASGIGASVYFQAEEKKAKLSAELVYDFMNTSLEDFKSGKKEVKALQDDWKKLSANAKQGQLPLPLIELSGILREKGYPDIAFEYLSALTSNFSSEPLLYMRLLYLKAVTAEETNNIEAAIQSLEKINSLGLSVLSEKTNLDLGRLYFKNKQPQRAKTSWQKVVDQAQPSDQLYKLAKYYLNQLVTNKSGDL